MLWQFIPWKFLIRRAAKAHGFIDPISFLARVRSFSQPSEVKEPMELVRANMLFQARGLINARAIQFNLDWVWPYWVERQFNPEDQSFIPRGYAPTHVNLTHRDWTAAGLPDVPLYPLVDPRGLVTPFYDGWSLDFIVVSRNGEMLLPSKLASVEQSLDMDGELAVRTLAEKNGLSVESTVRTVDRGGEPVLEIALKAQCGQDGRLVVSLRPYNPEGVQFVEKIRLGDDGLGWRVDKADMRFSRRPDETALSNYEWGDVLMLPERASADEVSCDIGMATAAAYFNALRDGGAEVGVEVPLSPDLDKHYRKKRVSTVSWKRALNRTPDLKIADERVGFLFEACKRTVVMLSAHEMYPGPFTYRRFWFRDSAFMGNALLALNLTDRLGGHLPSFPERQKRDGYFESQEGEWDSNGQVLWLTDRWSRASGRPVEGELLESMLKGADWITGKRMRREDDPLCDGLLPAGFSAEHLGPNDYYYWDDFWGVAGLGAASSICRRAGLEDKADEYSRQAEDFRAAIMRSIEAVPEWRAKGCIPASPFRRMDAGSIGSMVADYPLMVAPAGDERIMNTLEYIMENCSFGGGFFQDMVHSGINVYLTLDLAQTMLRAGDERFAEVLKTVADLATPTGTWPEAVHPFSGGGCMGDGQHGWAAAEWIMLVKNLFVREEGEGLVLGAGLLPQWIGEEAHFGPTATPYGPVSLTVRRGQERLEAVVAAEWNAEEPPMTLAVPGHKRLDKVEAGKVVALETA
jgi:hypothetical protein